jgi:hypothetical protein
MADLLLDTRGLNCPLPILKTKKCWPPIRPLTPTFAPSVVAPVIPCWKRVWRKECFVSSFSAPSKSPASTFARPALWRFIDEGITRRGRAALLTHHRLGPRIERWRVVVSGIHR